MTSDTTPFRQACPLCAQTQHQPFILGFDRLCARQTDFEYVRCLNCGLVFQNPLPADEQIGAFYVTDYKPYKSADIQSMDKRRKRAVNRFLIRHRFGVGPQASARPSAVNRALAGCMAAFAMKDTLLPYRECRLLDVGCGNGAWIYKHHRLGWQAEGVEINAEAPRHMLDLGIRIYNGTLFDIPDDRRYDIISFRHVIEHVPNPVETLSHATRLLAPEGRIIMLLPNLNSFGFRRYGNCWYPLDPPRHLLQFTPETIRRLGEKVGLRLLSLKTQIQPRMICFSRQYMRVFGKNYTSISDLEVRRTLVEKNRALESRSQKSFKVFRKILFLPALVHALLGRGETMEVTFQKE